VILRLFNHGLGFDVQVEPAGGASEALGTLQLLFEAARTEDLDLLDRLAHRLRLHQLVEEQLRHELGLVTFV
jgi:hypothetical protein